MKHGKLVKKKKLCTVNYDNKQEISKLKKDIVLYNVLHCNRGCQNSRRTCDLMIVEKHQLIQSNLFTRY